MVEPFRWRMPAEAYGRMMRNEASLQKSCWLPGSNHAPIQNGLLNYFFVGPATQSEAADAMNRFTSCAVT